MRARAGIDGRDARRRGSGRQRAAACLLAGAVAACGGAQTSRVDEALPDRCASAMRKNPRVLVIDLPGVEKARLQQAHEVGLTVVRFNGCTLEVVTGCTLAGSYTHFATSRAHDMVRVRNQDELAATVPFAAASLGGALKGDAEIHIDYVATGTRVARFDDSSPDPLRGLCSTGTHVVTSSVVGAYKMSSQRSTAVELNAAATLTGGLRPELKGGHRDSSELLRVEGDVGKCLNPQTYPDDPDCRALIQVELLPLETALEIASGTDDSPPPPSAEFDVPPAGPQAAGLANPAAAQASPAAARPRIKVAADKAKSAASAALQAAKAFEGADFSRAADLYALAWRVDPNEPASLFGQAQSEHMAGNREAAQAHYREFVALPDADADRVAKAKAALVEFQVALLAVRAREADRMVAHGDHKMAAATYLDLYRHARMRPEWLFQGAAALA